MSKRKYNNQPGKEYWKGICNRCGAPITRRTSLSVSQANHKGGTKLPRECRDTKGCQARLDDKVKPAAPAEAMVVES